MRAARLLGLLGFLLISTGCPTTPDSKDPDTGPTITDRDGDGFSQDDDCDDNDAAINPAATEICDGIDQDCDSTIDEDAGSSWFADLDGDSWGDAASSLLACNQPKGHVADATDCDDNDAAINPAATEICDTVDNDCDTLVDEDVGSTWFADGDGDSWGDSSSPVTACEAPKGFVADGTDCNDADAAINPGATEICDGLDNDCDMLWDEDLGVTWYADADGDSYGDATSTLFTCDVPNGYVADATDCDDTNAAVHPGAVEACDALDNDCDGLFDEEIGTWWYADIDADGFGDATTGVAACFPPKGWVADATDCDDTNAARFPGNPEICDGFDNDCNTLVDEGVLSTWYADTDGDTHGDATVAAEACAAPIGHVADATDCDDTSSLVFPGADEICDGLDNDCDLAIDEQSVDATLFHADADGDNHGSPSDSQWGCSAPAGFVADGSDCDDTDATVHPDATELCNGRDDDCDAIVDNGLLFTDWYEDLDGDESGNPDVVLSACAQPFGYVADGSDCDDSASGIHPGAVETCDDVDENCDGTIDDGVPVVEAWQDADADGFGDPTVSSSSCAVPMGFVLNDDDCDDVLAAVHPGATESCDATDENCDGMADEGIPTTSWYLDADADAWGSSFLLASCLQPSGYVPDSGDCDDTDASVNPGAAEVCDGLDEDCDGMADDGIPTTDWYSDADADGFGAGAPTASCLQPVGHVPDATDCNDAEPAIRPDAAEVCDEIDNDCNGFVDEGIPTTVWHRDADGDGYGTTDTIVTSCGQPAGYIADDTDCDDLRASFHPGATELCDGLDDDCDGLIDDGIPTTVWYLDADGDGYGSSGTTVASCAQPAGYSGFGTDCDDTRSSFHPGAIEQCDGEDNDCDGLVDDGITLATWYRDADADGYGTPSNAQTNCRQPTGFVSNYLDCDDANSAIHPGIAEVCDDVDQDCDGMVDENLAIGTWYRDADADGYGNPTLYVLDCIQPSGYVANANDCNDSAALIHPGVAEACDGVDNDCDGAVDEGVILTWYRDADGDTYGTTANTAAACSSPTGYVSNSTDCNDGAASIHPGATEICANAIDEDCDGTADDGCLGYTDHCGTISASTTWSPTTIHRVTCNLYVQGSTRPTLTIADGTSVVFANGTIMAVGWSSYGKLQVNGTNAGVTFSSYDSTPVAGDWGGLYFGQYDQTSAVEGLTLEYAGSTGNGGIYINNAGPTITGSIIRNNSGDGIKGASSVPTIRDSEITDNAGLGYNAGTGGFSTSVAGDAFSGNIVTGNGDYPVKILAYYGEEVASDNLLSGNGRDFVVLTADTLDATTTWHATDVPFQVQGAVYVQGAARPSLTVEDGAIVTFDAAASLFVATSSYGSLQVDGTYWGALFTSADPQPQPGDWSGIQIGQYDQGSDLLGAIVEYGGGNGYGNIYAVYSNPILEACSLENSSNDGFHGYGAFPGITDTTFDSNLGEGIYLNASSGLKVGTPSSPTFDGNILSGNGEYAMSVPANSLGEIGLDNLIAGNGDDYVRILADTVESSATWRPQDVPFLIEGSTYIQGASRPSVTIQDGTRFEALAAAAIYVGWSSYGSLTTQGTSEGVTFSSATFVPTAGDWNGLAFGQYTQSASTNLEGIEVEHGGRGGYGGIYVNNATISVSGCYLAHNADAGLYGNSATVAISDCIIEDNLGYGVELNSSSALSTAITPSFTDNILMGNTVAPITLPANSLGQLDASSSFVGNTSDTVIVTADTVEQSATWQNLDAPYHVTGAVYVQAAGHPVVTISPGATFRFDASTALYVGWSSYGSLMAQGTSSLPITFTSARSTPASGDWASVAFGQYCTPSQSILRSVIVEYGGSNNYGDIWLNYCNATVADSVVRNSSSWGIYRVSSAYGQISNITYSNNALGNLR